MEEGFIGGEESFMANEESAELPEPCVGSFDDPAAFVPPQFAAVLVASVFAGDAAGGSPLPAMRSTSGWSAMRRLSGSG